MLNVVNSAAKLGLGFQNQTKITKEKIEVKKTEMYKARLYKQTSELKIDYEK